MSKLLWCSQKGVWQNESQLKVYPSYVVDFLGKKKNSQWFIDLSIKKKSLFLCPLNLGLAIDLALTNFTLENNASRELKNGVRPVLLLGNFLLAREQAQASFLQEEDNVERSPSHPVISVMSAVPPEALNTLDRGFSMLPLLTPRAR